jgi:hypothetical protein
MGAERRSTVNKSIAVIASTALFALIGLLVGYVAISHLTGERSSEGATLFIMVMFPTLGGAFLGFIVSVLAIWLGR